jgi:hypothetical protein
LTFQKQFQWQLMVHPVWWVQKQVL